MVYYIKTALGSSNTRIETLLSYRQQTLKGHLLFQLEFFFVDISGFMIPLSMLKRFHDINILSWILHL